MLEKYLNIVICNDFFNILCHFPNECIDLIFCDLPYGITQNSWDGEIDISGLWKEYRRIIKKNGVIALFGWGKFSAKLILSAVDIYKYTIIWKKNNSRGHLNAKKQPLRIHEDILIFYDKQCTYNPQKSSGHKPVNKYNLNHSGSNYGKTLGVGGGGSKERYPTTVIDFPVVNNDSSEKFHPNQKPVNLCEYIISTYTNAGDTVLDNTCGSGSILVAAKNIKRNFIGIDIKQEYVNISRLRLKELERLF